MSTVKFAPHARDSRDRALAWAGKKFAAGWCLYFQVVHVYGVPGVGDADRDGAADAEDYWKVAVARGEVVRTSDPKSIPPGVMIMWTGGRNDHGHASYSLGDGKHLTTDLPRAGYVGVDDVDNVRKKWGLKLEGYIITDGNGWTLVRDDPKPVTEYRYTKADAKGLDKPDPAAAAVRTPSPGAQLRVVVNQLEGYLVERTANGDVFWPSTTLSKSDPTRRYRIVTAKTGLIVRAEPATSAKLLKLLATGDRVQVLEERTAGGRSWGRLTGGGWIALAYTNRPA